MKEEIKMKKQPERIAAKNMPKEVRDFYDDIKQYIWENVNKHKKGVIRTNCATGALVISTEMLYLMYSNNPPEERIEIEKEFQKIFEIACELAREVCWGEDIN